MEQRKAFMTMIERLEEEFHDLYGRGCKDGSLITDLPEAMMFSCTFHIMLAAVTRYAVGLVYIPEGGGDPEKELVLLKELLLSRFTRQK